MKTDSTSKPMAAQSRQNAKIMTNAKPRRAQFRKNAPPNLRQPNARAPQNARAKYDRYLALARAETLAGDVIAAENYFQHAEHYFRSLREQAN